MQYEFEFDDNCIVKRVCSENCQKRFSRVKKMENPRLTVHDTPELMCGETLIASRTVSFRMEHNRSNKTK